MSLEEKLRRFTGLTSDYIHYCTRTEPAPFQIQWLDGAVNPISGYSTEEILAHGCVLPLVHPDDRPAVNAYLFGMRPGDRKSIEFRIVTKAQEVRWVSEKSYCEAGETAGELVLFGAITDITERKQTEAELRRSEAKYQRLVEGLGECHGIFSHTPEGHFLYVSQHFHKLFGVPADNILGRDWRELNLTLESIKAGEAADRRVLEGRCMQTVELTTIHPDGSRRSIEVTYGPVFEDGQVILMEGICTDITEKKQSAMDLAAAKEAAELANRAKSAFLTNMSHEIRNPITVIIGYTELLESMELSSTQRSYLEAVLFSAGTLLDLVNDILDLSKIEARKFELDCKEFSLRGIIDQVVEMQKAATLAKGLAVKVAINADVPDQITGDSLRLRQILLNLMSNAVKFTEKGSITVAVAVEERKPATVVLRVEVADTGIGIKPEDISKIFKPFSQVDYSMTRQFGGTGLGLAICKELSALMGGELWVESAEGVGSSFQLRMPFAVSNSPLVVDPLSPVERPSLWGSGSLRVLLVEDYEVNQRFFVEVLNRYGHHVDAVCNGAEALDKCGRVAYDLILMDLQMPVMDGFEAVRKLRELERETGGHTPVVALTAHAMEEERCEILRRGFDGYVAKPTKIRDLLNEMQRCLAVCRGG